MEKFFSNSYRTCRERFLIAAKEAGAELRTLSVVDDLTTDVAIFPGRSDSYLVHISGTHGPEGYAGSATQLAILTLMKEELRTSQLATTNNPTIILIHSLNPFGFHTGRRVNENNVDMNRNFLSPKLWEEVLSRDPNFAGYLTLDSAFNFTTMPTSNLFLNDIWGYLKLAKTFLVYGITNAKRALVAGNYHKPTGLGFGGQELQPSARNIIKLVEELEIPTKAKRVALVDVHSGLGPCGVDTLLYDLGIQSSTTSPTSTSSTLSMDSIFPPEYASDVWTVIDLAPSTVLVPLYVLLYIVGCVIELVFGVEVSRRLLGGMFSFVSGGLQDSVIGGD